MVKGLYTAHMGMINQQKRLDVLTNNLANADTVGYKKEGTTARSFYDTLAVKISDSSDYKLPVKIGGMTYGVTMGQTYDDFSQGSFNVTNDKYDVALKGDGFFAIAYTNKAGETTMKLTRAGDFAVNKEGYLVTDDGDYVLNQNGAMASNTGAGSYIRIDPNVDFTITSNGSIYQNGALAGQIGMVDVENYDYLERYGENMYDLVQGGQIVASNATAVQGSLEMSNVNIVSEMVDMINVSRAYEANQKIIQTMDSTIDRAVNGVGKV